MPCAIREKQSRFLIAKSAARYCNRTTSATRPQRAIATGLSSKELCGSEPYAAATAQTRSPASRLAIAVILPPARATRDRAGDSSKLPAVNDRVSTTDRCLLGLASQDCEEPVNSLALIDGQGAVGLDEEGHRAGRGPSGAHSR